MPLSYASLESITRPIDFITYLKDSHGGSGEPEYPSVLPQPLLHALFSVWK